MTALLRRFPAATSTLAAAAIAGVLGSGCTPADEATSSGPANLGPAASLAPPPLVMPDLSGLPEPVQAQVRQRHDALRRAGSTGATAAALGNAYGELGLILMATRFYEAAETAFGHAQALAPRQMRWPYYLAQLHRTTGDQPRAVESFERSVELDPTYVAALVHLGELYLDEGRAEEAEPLFEQALAVDPASAPALSGIGRAALAQGATARAIEYLERALAIGPSAWDIQYNLATAYREAGNADRAEEHLSRRGGDPPEPPDPLMRAYESLLRSPRNYETRGVAAMQDGRPAEAVEILPGFSTFVQEGIEVQASTSVTINGGGRRASTEVDPSARARPAHRSRGRRAGRRATRSPSATSRRACGSPGRTSAGRR